MSRIGRDRRGGVGILVGAGLPVFLGITAFAVDLGAAALDTRRLQGIADAAALAAAADPAHAQMAAENAVAASGWPRAITVIAQTGDYARNAATPPDVRFTARAAATDAVRVTLNTASPTYVARIFGRQSIPIARKATAAGERLASFSIGTRLVSINGGVLNAYLSALTGSTVSLSVADYAALASADVDLFGSLSALRTGAALQAVSFDDVLDTRVTYPQAFTALAEATSSPAAANAFRSLALQLPGGSVSLGQLIDPGPYGAQASGGAGIARPNGLAFATGVLQLGTPNRQVAVDLGTTIPGLTSTRLTIAVGERAADAPWVAITDNGTPIIRTAQARLYLETQLGGVSLPGIGGLATIRLPIYAELASAQARLSGVDCSTQANRSVSVEAMPSPGQAAIATIDPLRLPDFTSPIQLSTARLVDTLLVDVETNTRIDLGAAEQWQPLHFDSASVSAGSIQTVHSSTPTQGIAASLVQQMTLSVRVIGLPIPLTPLIQAVGAALATVAPTIDGLLDISTGALGVHYGEADVRVTGMRCGTATLVA